MQKNMLGAGMMNSRDKNNLDFLLSISNEALLEWWSQASEDDQVYASEILAEYEKELNSMMFGETFHSSNSIH
jgi:hypothetical protein